LVKEESQSLTNSAGAAANVLRMSFNNSKQGSKSSSLTKGGKLINSCLLRGGSALGNAVGTGFVRPIIPV
jgi:hypothetical protein